MRIHDPKLRNMAPTLSLSVSLLAKSENIIGLDSYILNSLNHLTGYSYGQGSPKDLFWGRYFSCFI